MYKILIEKQADKDLQKILKSNLKTKLYRLMEIIEETPYSPPVEKLTGTNNVFSRRINIQHRLVYEVNEETKTIKIIRMWSHYGDN